MRKPYQLLPALFFLILMAACTGGGAAPTATPEESYVIGILPTSGDDTGFSPDAVPTADLNAISSGITGITPTDPPPLPTLELLPTPTFTPLPITSVDSIDLIQPGFMIAVNTGDQPIPWLRCLSDSGWGDPVGRCSLLFESLSTFNLQFSIPSGAAQPGNGGVEIVPGAYVSITYLIRDSGGTWWAATSYQGWDLLPWCGGIESGLVLYDLSLVPGYDPFAETPLNRFARLAPESYPEPFACPG